MKHIVFKFFQVKCEFNQIIATIASGWLSVASGFVFGFSAVLLPELEKDESFPYDKNIGSWIASITPLSMVIGCLCAGSLIDGMGRKTGHIVLAILSIISWIIIALATNNTFMLIGRFIAGLSVGSNRPVSLVYLGEITDPKYRSLTLIGPSISLSLGIFITHVLGGYMSWRTGCYVYAGTNLSCLIVLLFLKESPLWLISKGKTSEGIEAFKWFRGDEVEAQKELQLVLQRQNEKSNNYLIKDIVNLSFLKPLVTVFFLACIQFNGVNIFTFYAQDMFEKTFNGSIDPYLVMVGMDVVRLLIVILIFACNKFIPRKIFFMIVNFGCSIILFALVAYMLHLDSFRHIWLSVIITIFYMAFGGSVVALAWSFVPEIFSANLRGLGSGIGAAFSYFLLFVCVKITPDFMASYSEAAMYCAFGVISTLNIIVLYFLLPETNGRTLQDIEDSYKKHNNNSVSSL